MTTLAKIPKDCSHIFMSPTNIRREFPWVLISVFLGGSLLLAVVQMVLLFSGWCTKADFSAAIGELLLVVVLAVGEIVAFLELGHIAKEGEFNSWLAAQNLWNEEPIRLWRANLFKRLRTSERQFKDSEKDEAKKLCGKMDQFAYLAEFFEPE